MTSHTPPASGGTWPDPYNPDQPLADTVYIDPPPPANTPNRTEGAPHD